MADIESTYDSLIQYDGILFTCYARDILSFSLLISDVIASQVNDTMLGVTVST